MRTVLSRYALSMGAAAAFLAGCGGSQPPMSASALAPSGHAVSPVRARERSFHGYYLTKFTDEVGSILTFSSLCLRFKSSGAWSSVPPNTFIGTYALHGDELFAPAIAPWSPTIYASLQGSINGTQGSGHYIVMQPNGELYSGGTFTMTRARSGCR
jgi:hypothetical protein